MRLRNGTLPRRRFVDRGVPPKDTLPVAHHWAPNGLVSDGKCRPGLEGGNRCPAAAGLQSSVAILESSRGLRSERVCSCVVVPSRLARSESIAGGANVGIGVTAFASHLPQRELDLA